MTAASPGASAEIVQLAWLSSDALVALARATPADHPDGLRLLVRRGRTGELRTRWLDCSPGAAADEPHDWLLTASLPEDVRGERVVTLLLGDRRRLRPFAPEAISAEPAVIARTVRTTAEPAVRELIQRFLAAALAADGDQTADPALAASLAAMRDEIREPLPTAPLEPGRLVARLEAVRAIDSFAFWLSGWAHTLDPARLAMTAISPEGVRTDVARPAISFHPRPAIAERLAGDQRQTAGFHMYLELDQPSVHPNGWLLEFREPGGETIEDRASEPVITATEAVLEPVLEQLRATPQDGVQLAEQVLPALARLRGGRHDPQVTEVHELGSIPASPDVSVVIAINGTDRIEHLLAQFARDPELEPAEVVFVVPGDEQIHELAAQLSLLYAVGFRLVMVSKPARRPLALNLGASHAHGACLVLMSGDVLPSAPGWLGALRSRLDPERGIVAVGPKLLNEDGSIAHAGTGFRSGLGATRWERTWPFAGLSGDLPEANVARPILAASDACVMVDAASFRGCGGMPQLYQGGDEGPDLCLQLAEDGGATWYEPAAELYNLNRPAVARPRSPVGVRFDDWLLDRRWGARLARDGGIAAT